VAFSSRPFLFSLLPSANLFAYLCRVIAVWIRCGWSGLYGYGIGVGVFGAFLFLSYIAIQVATSGRLSSFASQLILDGPEFGLRFGSKSPDGKTRQAILPIFFG